MASPLERHAEQLSALGHPVRLRILRHVVQAGEGGAAAGEIQSVVGLPASTLWVERRVRELLSARGWAA